MNLNQFYHYYKSKSGGLSNLLLGSEELDQSDQGEWVRYNMNAVNANVPGVANPLSSDETVEQLDFQASTVARIAQTVTLTAGTEYTFSVWARAASGTKPFRLRYWDNVGGSGGGSAFTASATWSASTGRYEMTFTAQNSGTFQMFIQNAGGTAASRRIYFWGAMLNVGATALDYVKTEFPIGLSNPPTPPMEFGDNFAGVTAYYSLRRFTKGEDNNAIRVRRSSDDTEQDIGFDANGDLDTTALTTFVNAAVNQYTSDFSSTEDLNESNGTGAAAQSVGGVDDAYKFTLSGGAVSHFPRVLGALNTSDTFNISFEFYIPSSNSALDGIQLYLLSGSPLYNTLDAWTSVSLSNVTSTSDQLRFYATDGGSLTVNGDGDVFYLKNIVITQTTADGHVTTWYDQSGNGNNATNATASQQPKIVEGGVMITENSHPAIEFNRTTTEDILSAAVAFSQPVTHFFVRRFTDLTSSIQVPLSYQAGVGTPWGEIHYQNLFRTHFGAGYLGTFASVEDLLLQYVIADGTSSTIAYNGAQGDTGNAGTTGVSALHIGRNSSAGTYESNVKVQELIVFASDQSANRTGMETNINDHFSIYP